LSRSKHTRPQEIIAARRVRLPREPRGAGDISAARRAGALLKQLGIAAEEFDDAGEDDIPQPRLPRITVERARRNQHHPAGKNDIEQLLQFFGARAFYGIKEIHLSQAPASAKPGRNLLFGRLFVPGKVVLYEQPVSPWFVPSKLSRHDKKELQQCGAQIETSDDGLRNIISWDENGLRDYMLFEVLMHEVGHHLIQHFKGKRKAQVMRTADHEQAAELFARKCRALYAKALDA
jgi:hypothetical protein